MYYPLRDLFVLFFISLIIIILSSLLIESNPIISISFIITTIIIIIMGLKKYFYSYLSINSMIEDIMSVKSLNGLDNVIKKSNIFYRECYFDYDQRKKIFKILCDIKTNELN